MNPFRLLAWLSSFMPLAAFAIPAASESLPPLLSEAEEVRIALEAAPVHLRAEAGVYVLEASGYRLARASRNGFHCLIDREIVTAFEPRCFDDEGSATLLPVAMFRAAQRARGVTQAAIDREIAARFRLGTFIAPRRVGICYMLSAYNAVVVERDTRRVQRVGPRLLLYAPHLGSAELGASPDLEARLLVVDEHSESAMIVVPVASAKRTRAHYFSPESASPLSHSRTAAVPDAVPRTSLND